MGKPWRCRSETGPLLFSLHFLEESTENCVRSTFLCSLLSPSRFLLHCRLLSPRFRSFLPSFFPLFSMTQPCQRAMVALLPIHFALTHFSSLLSIPLLLSPSFPFSFTSRALVIFCLVPFYFQLHEDSSRCVRSTSRPGDFSSNNSLFLAFSLIPSLSRSFSHALALARLV